MLNWRRGQGQSVMKLMQCSGLPEIYAQLEEGGPSAKYEHNVHSAIYETYLVYWFSRDLCSVGGGQSVMKLMQCSCLPEIYAQLIGGLSAQMSTLQNLLLLHRGLFYERPMSIKRLLCLSHQLLCFALCNLLCSITYHH